MKREYFWGAIKSEDLVGCPISSVDSSAVMIEMPRLVYGWSFPSRKDANSLVDDVKGHCKKDEFVTIFRFYIPDSEIEKVVQMAETDGIKSGRYTVFATERFELKCYGWGSNVDS